MATYRTIEEALAGVGRPGWRVVGQEPQITKTTTKDPRTGESVETQERTGTIWSIQGPNGEPDTMVVNDVDDPQVKGGKAIGIVTGPTKNLPAGNKASAPGGWTPVYRVPNDSTSGQIGQWDPVNNEFHPQAADPSAKPSGTYDNVIDPNDPAHKRVIGIVDKGDASWHAVSSDPNLPGRQIITTPTAVYAVDAENKVSKLVDIDKDSPFQAVIVDGKPFKFDPKNGTFTAGPVNEHPDIKDASGNPMVWQQQADGSGKYAYPAGVSPAATVGNSTTLKELVWYDNQGNEVSRKPNPNYVETPAQAASPNTTAPYIQVPDPQHPSQLIWVENKARVTASQALKDLASHLTGQVVDGNISVDEAKALIEASNQRMTAETQQQQNTTTAATGILANTRGNAQTGAGVIQQRVQAAQGMLNTVLGLAGQGQRSGNMGGGLMNAPAGLGEALVNGIQGWTADLSGGQATLDSAARLVQMADPRSNMADPATQQAIGVLQQMLDKHQELTGVPHPAVTATQAAQQSGATNGMTAPATLPEAQVVQPQPQPVFQAPYQYDPRFQPQLSQQPAGTVLPAGVAGTVPYGDPRFMGFVAPAAAPTLAPVTVG